MDEKNLHSTKQKLMKIYSQIFSEVDKFIVVDYFNEYFMEVDKASSVHILQSTYSGCSTARFLLLQ